MNRMNRLGMNSRVSALGSQGRRSSLINIRRDCFSFDSWHEAKQSLHKLCEAKLELWFSQFFRSIWRQQFLLDAELYSLVSFLAPWAPKQLMVPLNTLIPSLQPGWILPKSLLGEIRTSIDLISKFSQDIFQALFFSEKNHWKLGKGFVFHMSDSN